MHGSGVNHRDFYLCHFLLSRSWLDTGSRIDPPLYLIDLHRGQVRRRVPRRWVEKDLAGLYFSSMDAGLTRRDHLRFITCYENRSVRQVASASSGPWQRIDRMAARLYRKFQKHMAKRAQ
jgi:heptose I phosphotransferase